MLRQNFRNSYFYIDWADNTVERAIKETGENRTVLNGHLKHLMSLQAVSVTKKGRKNDCSDNNGDCSHICLMTPLGKKCSCPTGFEMQEGSKCVKPEAFMIFVGNGKISRAGLTASSDNFMTRILNGVVNASAIATDNQNVYWTNR